METTASRTAEKIGSKAGEAMEKTKEQMEEARIQAKRGLQRSAEYIREHPRQSALTALGLGALLAQLPLRFLATGLAGLFLMLLKPAAFLYAGLKIAEDYRENRAEPNGSQPREREEPFHQGVPKI